MIERTVQVTNKLGLHARAAAQVVRTASGFKSTIELSNGQQTANAKGIMSLMMLAATCGSSLVVKAQGDDECHAMQAIEKMFADRFGEDE